MNERTEMREQRSENRDERIEIREQRKRNRFPFKGSPA